MGYPLEQLVNEEGLPNEFKCPVCLEILKDPKMIKKCEHFFCGECIQQCLASADKACPICRNRASLESLRRPMREFLALLGRIEMRCKFTENFGCGKVTTLELLEAHEDGCVMNPNVKQPCQDGCGGLIGKLEMESHDCVVYLQEQIQNQNNQLETIRDGGLLYSSTDRKKMLATTRVAIIRGTWEWSNMGLDLTRKAIRIMSAELVRNGKDWIAITYKIQHVLRANFGEKWICLLSAKDSISNGWENNEAPPLWKYAINVHFGEVSVIAYVFDDSH